MRKANGWFALNCFGGGGDGDVLVELASSETNNNTE